MEIRVPLQLDLHNLRTGLQDHDDQSFFRGYNEKARYKLTVRGVKYLLIVM